MEVIIFLVLFYGGIWLIGTIVSKISETIRRKRERIRDQVASEVLNGLNIESVIDNYKNKLAHIRHTRADPIRGEIEKLKEQIWGKNAVLMERCPRCKKGHLKGHLILRKGQYGKFLACTEYPKCDYTKNISKAREEYKKSINEQIVEDVQKAYL